MFSTARGRQLRLPDGTFPFQTLAREATEQTDLRVVMRGASSKTGAALGRTAGPSACRASPKPTSNGALRRIFKPGFELL